MSNVERIINNQLFGWDDEKAEINRQKHRITFNTAAQVFADENRIERYDDIHSVDEDRWITIGRVKEILFVVYTERVNADNVNVTRLISARRATTQERSDYYDGLQMD
ncbi:MAG: BrnT family toxin [Selenomonadaceae bacterium]|nr:BrnT family toxin [Selenomonadaceae bacterium]